MVKVILENVCKYHGDSFSLSNVNFAINKGEIFTFLGPSGCGKTTVYRLLSATSSQSAGQIMFNDMGVQKSNSIWRRLKRVFSLSNRGDISRENVSCLLGVENASGKLVRKKVEIKEVIQSDILNDITREGSNISWMFLLDEPFSSQEKYGPELYAEFKRSQRKLGITTVCFTRNVEDALAISDRIAVLHRGRLLQVGTPEELLEKPVDINAAKYVGWYAVIEGIIDSEDEYVDVILEDSTVHGVPVGETSLQYAQHVACLILPEDISLNEPDEPCNELEAVIENSASSEYSTELSLLVSRTRLLVNVPKNREYGSGDYLKFYVPKMKTLVLPWVNIH